MTGEATHCWVVVLDIENFSSRPDPIQRSLRTGMYEVLREALVRAGLPANDIVTEDRGDGILMIIPATVSPIVLAGPFVRALDDELAQKAVVYSPAHAMRFRVALHQGLAARDGEGWSGDAVNIACRLVAQPAEADGVDPRRQTDRAHDRAVLRGTRRRPVVPTYTHGGIAYGEIKGGRR